MQGCQFLGIVITADYGIRNIDSTPVIVVNDQSDVIIVKDSKKGANSGKRLPSFAVASGGYCYNASRPIRKADAQVNTATGNNVMRSILTRRRNAHL